MGTRRTLSSLASENITKSRSNQGRETAKEKKETELNNKMADVKEYQPPKYNFFRVTTSSYARPNFDVSKK